MSNAVPKSNAKPGTWPWQVTMDYKGHADKPQWCDGSIVSPQWIVVSMIDDPDQYTIVAGNLCMLGNVGLYCFKRVSFA